MRFPFFRNRDSVKNGILISIRRTGDGFHPGLFTVLLFQAERDDFVSVNALRKFAEKINHRGITSCEYVYLPGTRHETYRSDDRTMEMYLDKIMKFMDSGMVSDSCT